MSPTRYAHLRELQCVMSGGESWRHGIADSIFAREGQEIGSVKSGIFGGIVMAMINEVNLIPMSCT